MAVSGGSSALSGRFALPAQWRPGDLGALAGQVASVVTAGCPEFRGTLGGGPLMIRRYFAIIAWRCDSCLGVSFECGSESGQVQEPVDPAELLGRFTHAGRAPAQGHLAVAPALDVGGVVPADLDHRLDGVGGPQGASQRRRHVQTGDGGCLCDPGCRGSPVRVGRRTIRAMRLGLG